MKQNFEQILEDNYCLKKSLTLARHQNQKLQQEVSQLRLNYQELLDKNIGINNIYTELQKKNQLQLAQHNKDVSTLTSQIQELKSLIDQKQSELENFQIKMIPNLDQDMIRVKLITEMEGPYQDTIDKKDRQINKLKDKLTQMERKYNLCDLQLNTKQKECKRQIEQTKNFYQTQNEKLLKELNILLNKKQIKSYDKQVFRNQRKQLEELRYTIDLHSKNEQDLRKQLLQAKIEKEKLLSQICEINQKKALELHLSSQNAQIRSLKEQIKRMEDDYSRKNDEISRLQKKIRNLEKQAKANEEEMKRSFAKNKEFWENEKENLLEQLRRERDRRGNNPSDQDDDHYFMKENYRSMEKELQLKRSQCERYKVTIEELQKVNRELQYARKKKISLTKDIVNDSKLDETKQNNLKKSNEDKDAKIKELERIIAKLKQKLEIANRKIVQLLKEKARNNSPQKNDQRDRTFSNIEIGQFKPQSDKAFLLEYRDTSLVPLVPPTIFTHQTRK